MILGLLCGASIGREGPTVQVGAALMFAVGRRRRIISVASCLPARQPASPQPWIAARHCLRHRGVEPIFRVAHQRPCSRAIIAAGLTSLGFLATIVISADRSGIPTRQGLAGAAGLRDNWRFFRRPVQPDPYPFRSDLPGRAGRADRQIPDPFAIICGFGVAARGLASQDTTMARAMSGERIVHGTMPACRLFAPMKFLATLFSFFAAFRVASSHLARYRRGDSGQPASVFSDVPLGALALIGMVSYSPACCRRPLRLLS